MIDSKELRSGNYLQGEPFSHTRMGIYSDGITQITAYGIAMIETEKGFAEHYSPIPLTEEWLNKLGLKKETGYLYKTVCRFEFQDGHLEETDGWWSWRLCTDKEYDQWSDITSFQFVHELQNLHFALAGTDLEINDKTNLTLTPKE